MKQAAVARATIGAGLLMLCSAVLIGCAHGSAPRKPESALDSAAMAYQRGLARQAQSDPVGMAAAFQRAVDLDPNFAPGHEGLGLVALERGGTEAAQQHFRKALDLDQSYEPARIGLARVATAKGDFEQADELLGETLKAMPSNLDALYWQGRNFDAWGHAEDAWRAFTRMLDLSPGDQRATGALTGLAEAEAAERGLPTEYVKIAGMSAITRQDLAALISMEIAPEKTMRRKPAAAATYVPPQQAGRPSAAAGSEVADVPADHWAAAHIRSCLACGIMDVMPDRMFHPTEPVSRVDFAVALQMILAGATGDDSLPSRYLGGVSEFRDVPVDHYGLSAIRCVTARSLMAADASGAFHPEGPVTGRETILVLKKMRATIGS
jgi:Flp pilus assembly protein TadD